MDFSTFALIVIAGVGIYYYFKQKLSYFKVRGVPYEPGLPLIGNMAPVLFKVKHVFEMVVDIYNAHPTAKYVGVFIFGKPTIILRDPELIKAITIKHFDHFQGRAIVIDKKNDPFIGASIFHAKNERWRATRNLLSPAFTSSKLKSMYKLMVECGKNFNEYLSGLPDEEMIQVATKDLFTKYTADVIATCIFGVAIDSLKNPNNGFYALGKKHIVDSLFMAKFYVASSFPWFMKLFNLKVVNDDVVSFFKNTLRSVIETRDKNCIRRPDLIQLMMDARDDNNKSTVKLDINAMSAEAFGFFVGGFDTSSTQMCIVAQELALNPNIQQKVQNEIDVILEETDGKLSYEAMQKMPYFDAVFNESLRRHTDFILIDRECGKPYELPPALPGGKPFVIEPGMAVWISGRSIHMDPKYYENPEKFEPERYHHQQKKNEELNLGFSIGPRSCIAQRFARLQIKILFFHLLSKFSLVADEKTNSPIKICKDRFVIKPKGGFYLSIKRRNK